VPLRVGILIAGSLDWRSEPYRVEWRNSRLIAHDSIPVNAPIRYGRLSLSNTYTMVYAPACPHGQAKIRLCRNAAAGIHDIIDEAKALWVAERPANSRPLPDRSHSADWGCVALLINPTLPDLRNLSNKWTAQVSLERDQHGRPTYDSRLYAIKGRSAINDRGLLQIPWPLRADTGMPFDACDLLLATATRPTPDPTTGDFPTAITIAEAWNSARTADYFHMNRKSGISTFQDEEIRSHLRT
jgi:hypothetical protein